MSRDAGMYEAYRDVPLEELRKIESEEALKKIVQPGGVPITRDDLRKHQWRTVGIATGTSLLAALLVAWLRGRR